eukprot:4177211-Prymnesium_polylepis.1
MVGSGTEQLRFQVVPDRCKARITKSRKLVVTLHKLNGALGWLELQSDRGLTLANEVVIDILVHASTINNDLV